VDAAGNAYVTGSTDGSDFPTTSGAYQVATTAGGSFVAKLSPSGNALVYSTYVLGASSRAIALDASGHAYIAGAAGTAFTTTAGALQRVMLSSTGTNAFVAKLNPTGTAMVYATFLGGTGTDVGKGIAVDAGGNALVGGWTTSADFPAVNAFQPSAQGGADGFVAKLDPAGAALLYSTRLGGALDDAVNAIAVDSGGAAYATGETYSANFPVKNAFQPVKPGYRLVNSSQGSAFVAKLSPFGDALAYSSFLGGEICLSACQTWGNPAQYEGDAAFGIAVDPAGHAYVTGLARSYTFPRVDSLLPAKQADNEDSLFVTKVALAGNALLYSTLVRKGESQGGSTLTGLPYGAGSGIAVDGAGGAYVTSQTGQPASFPTTPGAFQGTVAGDNDALVFKLSTAPASVTLATSGNPSQAGKAVTLTAAVTGSGLNGTVTFLDGAAQLGSASLSDGTAVLVTPLSAGIHRLSAVFRGSGTAADSVTLYQVVNLPLVCN
jgi:hypothetical protein